MYKIMIVEDDPVISGAVAKYLSGWGHQVRQAEDFRDILPLLREFGRIGFAGHLAALL